MNIHDKIMNLPQTPPFDINPNSQHGQSYRIGHAHARHAAAGLALEADAEIERLRAELAALRKDAERERCYALGVAETAAEIARLKRGECICVKCGLRQDASDDEARARFF